MNRTYEINSDFGPRFAKAEPWPGPPWEQEVALLPSFLRPRSALLCSLSSSPLSLPSPFWPRLPPLPTPILSMAEAPAVNRITTSTVFYVQLPRCSQRCVEREPELWL